MMRKSEEQIYIFRSEQTAIKDLLGKKQNKKEKPIRAKGKINQSINQ